MKASQSRLCLRGERIHKQFRNQKHIKKKHNGSDRHQQDEEKPAKSVAKSTHGGRIFKKKYGKMKKKPFEQIYLSCFARSVMARFVPLSQ